MKATKTLGPKTSLLFTKLHDQDRLVFDLNTAARLMEVDHVHAAGILHAASKRGLITPIRRGLYNLVPFEMGSVDFHLANRYAIVAASMEGKPYYLSHVSALDLHGLVTQPSFDVYVSTPHRLPTRNLGGAMVHFVTTRNAQFFGFAPHDLGNNHPVFASDLERALIDGFARPDYCGGMVEVAKAVFMAKSRVNFDKLVDYAHRMKIVAIIRRMGFVLETLGLADEVLVTKLKAGLPPGAVKLDPQLPIAGMHNPKWGLRLNVSAEEIQKAVSN
jgi:predicted transcriptional regulator of viral defense system